MNIGYFYALRCLYFNCHNGVGHEIPFIINTPHFTFLLRCMYNVEKIEEFRLKIFIDKISKVV
jgi:hypothetical protein